jgi:hypothetical protein
VKNFYEVLSQKEQDIVRLRKEIAALRLAIPLLEESDPSWNKIESQLSGSDEDSENPDPDAMTDMERYYPFVKTMQNR